MVLVLILVAVVLVDMVEMVVWEEIIMVTGNQDLLVMVVLVVVDVLLLVEVMNIGVEVEEV